MPERATMSQYMETTLIQYLIICPLVFIAGFIDAIAGGGGLITLPAYMIAGLPAHNAIATNKMASTMGTTAATIKYAKDGYINWKHCALAAFTALAGSTLGSNLALILSDEVFSIIMACILPLTAIYVLTHKSFESTKEPFSEWKTIIICAIIAFFIGIYDGFYGPGTGTFLLLLLTGLARITLDEAAGTTKVINLTTNVTALTVFLINGKVFLPLGAIAGVFSIAGNWLGASAYSKKGIKFARPLICLVLAIFLVKLIVGFIGN